jgi:hypothetical protein
MQRVAALGLAAALKDVEIPSHLRRGNAAALHAKNIPTRRTLAATRWVPHGRRPRVVPLLPMLQVLRHADDANGRVAAGIVVPCTEHRRLQKSAQGLEVSRLSRKVSALQHICGAGEIWLTQLIQ